MTEPALVVWRALLAAARGDESAAAASGLVRDPVGGWTWLTDSEGSRRPANSAADDIPPDLWSLYLPFLPAAGGQDCSIIIGHLGQSLDGYIATHAGDSCFVTGSENITHLHRMRALADAVVIGAGTAAVDDPRLTTRLVPGPNPVRVVLDPDARVPRDRQLFTDGCAPTLVCCSPARDRGLHHGAAELVEVPMARDADAGLDLAAVVAELRARGLRRLFVEGGGVTVSRFLQQGLLDRLQIAVAPLIIGAGRRGVTLPASERLADALRPSHRIYRMGADVLFDCAL